MCTQISTVSFSLPKWISTYIKDITFIETIEDRMRFVIEASRLNISEKTGGPFAAAIFEKDTEKLISLGVNLVTTQNLSMLHAEMVAITLAQKKLDTYDLGADGFTTYELVISSEPCAMCLGAIPWSGIRHVITGANDADIRAIGFDEGAKVADWKQALEERNIEVITEVMREDAIKILSDYATDNGHIYNSREAY